MSDKILSALDIIARAERTSLRHPSAAGINVRAKVVVTIFFLLSMLSLPVERLSELILFFLYPILTAAIGGLSYGYIFRRSLLVVPFVALIALPNIFLQRDTLFVVGEVAIRMGWITSLSIVLRGILSVQAIIILISTTGFYATCYALRQMGMPAILITLLFFTMRYLRLLLEQALAMRRALSSRGFGRRHYPFKMWSIFISQLLLRSVRRAENIGEAMAARQFQGEIPPPLHHHKERWRRRDTLYSVAWCGVLLLMRTLHFAERFF